MNSSKKIGIAILLLSSITCSFAAEIRESVKFDSIAISIVMTILEPQGIEKHIISKGWINDFDSEERLILLKKYDGLICTPLEDSPQLRKLAKEKHTVLIALSFLSEDIGSDAYLQLAKYHIVKELNADDSALYLLMDDILGYWLSMKNFQYHEKKGLTIAFLVLLNKKEATYKKDAALTAKINELLKLIKP